MSEVDCMHVADQDVFCMFHPFTDSHNKYPQLLRFYPE